MSIRRRNEENGPDNKDGTLSIFDEVYRILQNVRQRNSNVNKIVLKGVILGEAVVVFMLGFASFASGQSILTAPVFTALTLAVPILVGAIYKKALSSNNTEDIESLVRGGPALSPELVQACNSLKEAGIHNNKAFKIINSNTVQEALGRHEGRIDHKIIFLDYLYNELNNNERLTSNASHTRDTIAESITRSPDHNLSVIMHNIKNNLEFSEFSGTPHHIGIDVKEPQPRPQPSATDTTAQQTSNSQGNEGPNRG